MTRLLYIAMATMVAVNYSVVNAALTPHQAIDPMAQAIGPIAKVEEAPSVETAVTHASTPVQVKRWAAYSRVESTQSIATKANSAPAFKTRSAEILSKHAKLMTAPKSQRPDDVTPVMAVKETQSTVSLRQVTGRMVNARSAPTTASDVLARLARGAEVVDTGEAQGDWAKVVVETSGLEVWMHMNFLSEPS